ncbi:zinc-ribbon domain-containing protein [Candidatus Pelagibacter sp.]|nr:zinc-ribbon domain-containing protein [Candidatus Pelagibacter sp.]
MIITCNNCNKKFDLDSNLIPDIGRLLQCASCNHKWFFKKEILENTVSPIVEDIDNDNVNVFDQNNPTNNKEINPSGISKEQVEINTVEKLDEKIEIYNKEETEKNIEDNINDDIPVISKPKKPKNFKILKSFIVAIISFVALIIIIDTFKNPIRQVVPNIEFILYNLYESTKDILLFIRDLT